jgi:hypothetical protein
MQSTTEESSHMSLNNPELQPGDINPTTDPEFKLTPAQQRYLDEIETAGERRYNGRARRTVEALRDAGLIEFDYDQRAQEKGNGIELVEIFICRPR